MINRQRKRNRFKFTEKTHSKKGMAATILSALLLVLYGVFLIKSFHCEGTLSMYFGSAGVFAAVVAVITVVLAIQSNCEENSFALFPRIALLVSILAAVCWIGTYIMGIIM